MKHLKKVEITISIVDERTGHVSAYTSSTTPVDFPARASAAERAMIQTFDAAVGDARNYVLKAMDAWD